MSTFINIAWKNIWRNKRRTLLTVAAIAFSIAITLATIAMADGSHDAMLRQAIELFTGYVQVHRMGYQDNPGIEKSFKLTPEITQVLEREELISGYSPRLQFGALIASEKNSMGTMVVGMIPSHESKVTVIGRKKMIEGEYLSDGDKGKIIIGNKLAENLNVKIGEDLVILTQGIDGSTGALRYKLKGIFRSGTDAMDRGIAFITLKDAQDLLLAEGMVDCIAINTTNPKKVDEITKDLRAGFGAPIFTKDDFTNWKSMAETLNHHEEPIKGLFWNSLDMKAKKVIGSMKSGEEPDEKTKTEIINAFNKILTDRNFYSENAFKGFALTDEGEKLKSKGIGSLSPDELIRFNRILIQRIFPFEIAGKYQLEVMDWKQLMPEMVSYVKLDEYSGYLFLLVLIIVVIFGVLSAVFTSVLERTTEFGILLALGTKPRQVVLMVMLEALLLTAVGVLIGAGIGLSVSLYYVHHPIPLPESTSAMTSMYGMENVIYFAIYPEKMLIAILLVTILSLLFSYYPAVKASNLKPDRAIRNITN